LSIYKVLHTVDLFRKSERYRVFTKFYIDLFRKSERYRVLTKVYIDQ
jgi:hypothetical protein